MNQPQTLSPESVDQIRAAVVEFASACAEFEPRLEFAGIDSEGTVQIRVAGAAGCCPASAVPWVQALQRDLAAKIPGVRFVEVVA